MVQELKLEGNNLVGTLPPESVLFLSNAVFIDLGDNRIYGNMDVLFGNTLSSLSLEWLRLEFNEFSGTLSTEVGRLTKLETLNIAENPLTGTLPTEIGNLLWLRDFNIEDTFFGGRMPTEIGMLTSLEKQWGKDVSFVCTIL
jgi:Leucine-rich repeat (LRR) protein